jgi:hypothetical protein
MRWQIIKQIESDLTFSKTYSYIDGELYMDP